MKFESHSTTLPFVVDVDDLVDPLQLDLFSEIRALRPDFHVTCYSIPNKLGPIHDLKPQFPWVTFAIHGFEHTHFECLTWTYDEARRLLSLALSMGYEPLFKAPNWLLDIETERACKDLNITLHHHIDYVPTTPGLQRYHEKLNKSFVALHTHISPNPATDWIETHPGFSPKKLEPIKSFHKISEFSSLIKEPKA